jgi:hypothetical protein
VTMSPARAGLRARVRLDMEPEAELASFAALSTATGAATGNQAVHPDQLDLLELLTPTDPDHQAQEQS